MQLGEDEKRKRGRLGRRLLVILILAALVAAALAIFRVGAAPQVEVSAALPAIGRATPVTVRASAAGRGLVSLRLELVQGERTEVLAERTYHPRPFWAFWGERTTDDTVELTVGADTVEDLVEGEAVLRAVAGRAGTPVRHPEPVVVEQPLPVRLTPPSLSILSTQVNVAQGGAGAVVYRVGPTSVRDGVGVDERWFPGYPLPGGQDGERFALFAAPYDLEEPSRIQVVAVDEVGNEARAAAVDRYQPKPPEHSTIRIDDAFMGRVVPEILSRSPQVEEGKDLLASYLAINGDLRRANAETLAELARESRQEFLWSEPFLQLPGSQVMSSFADRRTYVYEGRDVDHQDHLGFDLASHRHAPVASANRGVVVLASYLGIYGNTVVVDHGYGLHTLYAHLSSIGVTEGQTVERGQELGRTGETGLAGGDHLHFAVLLQGLPVNPLEWWDARWIRDHLAANLGRALPFGG